jgi:hypothetical protein
VSLNFPATPAEGQTYTAEGRTFRWVSGVWLMDAEFIPWASTDEALAATVTDKIMAPATMKSLIDASEPPPASYGPLTCRAWGLIQGSDGAILASRNLASVVMSPEGQYAVTFQTPLSNAGYLIHGNSRFNDTKMVAVAPRINVAPTVNGFSFTVSTTGGSGVVGVPRGVGRISIGVFL